jgi:hemoglobin
MSNETLYEKFGGEENIAKVVDTFYELVLADDTVNHFFKETDMEKQLKHQTKFISFALGGPNQYSGKSMAKAHQGMNIQPEQFQAIAGHLKEALLHFGVAESDVNMVLASVSELKDDVLYK